MKELAQLAGGDIADLGDLESILSILSGSCHSYGSRAFLLLSEQSTEVDVTDLGPFVARRLLEATSTACLCRIDPIRILYLSKCQAEESYELTSPHSASVQWTGDIIPSGTQKQNSALWQTKSGTAEIDRSLLSAHNAEIVWKPAFTELLNALDGREFSSWKENVQKITPDNFAAHVKGLLSQEFSALSKGTHQEFVIPTEKIYDTATVRQHIRATFFYVSLLAATTHFIPFSVGRLDGQTALDLFLTIGGQLEAQQ